MGGSHKRTIGKRLKEIEKQAKNKVGRATCENKIKVIKNTIREVDRYDKRYIGKRLKEEEKQAKIKMGRTYVKN